MIANTRKLGISATSAGGSSSQISGSWQHRPAWYWAIAMMILAMLLILLVLMWMSNIETGTLLAGDTVRKCLLIHR